MSSLEFVDVTVRYGRREVVRAFRAAVASGAGVPGIAAGSIWSDRGFQSVGRGVLIVTACLLVSVTAWTQLVTVADPW